MQKNILIVDDSALMRRVLSDIINMDKRFHCSVVATNGVEALELLSGGYKEKTISNDKGNETFENPGNKMTRNEKFDAILLDINMPKMNGLEFLEQLEKLKIKATVIIVSTVAKEGAKETIRALELGAFDFVTKPNSFLDVKSDNFKNSIINSLLVATKLYQVSSSDIMPYEKSDFISKRSSTDQEALTPRKIKNKARTFTGPPTNKKLICIACSTGGPKALQKIVPLLPENIDCSVLIVQHMPEGFTLSLSSRLNDLSKIKVKEAEDGDILKDGTAYIAKGGRQMRLIFDDSSNDKLAVTFEEPRNGLRPCADILFESLCNSRYQEIICVVLTGMGSDGTKGIMQLKKDKDIYVIAQDEATSTVYGMPKVITEVGLVDEVVPLEQIASAIVRNLGVR